MNIGFASALPFADAGLADTSRAAGLGLVARLCTASRVRHFGALSTRVSGGVALKNRATRVSPGYSCEVMSAPTWVGIVVGFVLLVGFLVVAFTDLGPEVPDWLRDLAALRWQSGV